MADRVLRAPGFYDREIDLSKREVQPTGTPAAVIGASLKGPAFTPVTVGSYSDWEAKFGSLDPKLVAGYGIQKFLENRQSAIFIRTLGVGGNRTSTDFEATRTKGIVVNAGMQVSGTVIGGSDNRHAGAVQFLAAKHKVTGSEALGFPLFTDNRSYSLTNNFVHLVRGIIFTTYDSRIMVMDHNQSYTTGIDDAATVDDTTTGAMYQKFKLVISSSAGSTFATTDGLAGLRILTASLDPSSNNYFGKILNTNPDRFSTDKHLLYCDFAVDAEIAAVASGSSNADSVVILSGSRNTSSTSGDTSMVFRNAFGRYDTRYTTPKTPWFISQPFGTTEYDLFYVESIDDGEYANDKFKISIVNLKASSDPRNDYGTFGLLVRNFTDNDLDVQVIEQYDNLSLDPNASNYVARVIGDMKVSYIFDAASEDDRKLTITGKYPNRSKYIRVIMNSNLETGDVPAKSLPFGFRGFGFINTNTLLTDGTPNSVIGRMEASGAFTPRLTGSIIPPMPYRFKVTRGEVSTGGAFTGASGGSEIVDSRYFWGVKQERTVNILDANNTYEQTNLIPSLTKFMGLAKLDVLVTGSRMDNFNENKFTLARVALPNNTLVQVTASANTHMKEAAYIRNGDPDGTNYYISDGAFGNRVTFATLLSKGTASDFNKFTDFSKFTTVLYGGWDGVNIFDKDASRFADRASSAESGSIGYGGAHGTYSSPGATPTVNYNGTGIVNNVVNSIRTAIDIATDEIKSPINLLAIPGQRDPLVTDYAALKNKNFDLSFYIMDIPYYDYNSVRIFDGETGKLVSIEETADAFDARAINNDSVGAYFPNIVIDDSINNKRVVVPASVAALAAYGFNDKVAFPWYAPAGFNRAALNFVASTTVKVNQSGRNKLYDTRINSVVKFPREGYVFFTQNTLKQGLSALTSINVARMMIETKRAIINAANSLIFENISSELRTRFVSMASNFLADVQTKRGIEEFRIICDDTNNTSADVDALRMNGTIRIRPTKAVEFIVMDFIVTPSGVSFSSL